MSTHLPNCPSQGSIWGHFGTFCLDPYRRVPGGKCCKGELCGLLQDLGLAVVGGHVAPASEFPGGAVQPGQGTHWERQMLSSLKARSPGTTPRTAREYCTLFCCCLACFELVRPQIELRASCMLSKHPAAEPYCQPHSEPLPG